MTNYGRIPPVLALVLLATAACSPGYPPLATAGGDAAFKARIAERYPPGSPAARLREDLVRDGFAVSDDGRRGFAAFAPDNLPCWSRTRVEWIEDGRGRIVRVAAQRLDCS